MELTTIFIIVVVLFYLSKNAKGKQILDNVGDTAVELSAASKSAATALHKQCDELLSDERVSEAKARAKAKLTETEDDADYSDIL